MALQLSSMVGTLAFPDRMGDDYPELLEAGRIVQGHSVSGVMSTDMVTKVNQDLKDQQWRSSFHEALTSNQQFQRGLVTFAQDHEGRSTRPADLNALLQLQQAEWEHECFEIETVKTLSEKRLSQEASYCYEYGFALIKTSASLVYTIQLCQQLNVVAATDSSAHHQLLSRTCQRDSIALHNHCIPREGY